MLSFTRSYINAMFYQEPEKCHVLTGVIEIPCFTRSYRNAMFSQECHVSPAAIEMPCFTRSLYKCHVLP